MRIEGEAEENSRTLLNIKRFTDIRHRTLLRAMSFWGILKTTASILFLEASTKELSLVTVHYVLYSFVRDSRRLER